MNQAISAPSVVTRRINWSVVGIIRTQHLSIALAVIMICHLSIGKAQVTLGVGDTLKFPKGIILLAERNLQIKHDLRKDHAIKGIIVKVVGKYVALLADMAQP